MYTRRCAQGTWDVLESFAGLIPMTFPMVAAAFSQQLEYEHGNSWTLLCGEVPSIPWRVSLEVTCIKVYLGWSVIWQPVWTNNGGPWEILSVLALWVATVLEIIPRKEWIWGVVLFAEGGRRESMTVRNGGTLAFGKLFVEPCLACETATVLWLSKFEADRLGKSAGYIGVIIRGG
jgi:hypothetical protein